MCVYLWLEVHPSPSTDGLSHHLSHNTFQLNYNQQLMKNLVENIAAGFEAFAKDAAAQVESGNKAAGARARKVSLELEKLLKQFRKDSIAATK